MKRSSFCLALVAIMFTGVGCFNKYDPTPEQIASNSKKIESTTRQGVAFGMKQWAAKNPELAKQVAAQITKNINEVVIPYLDNNQGVASSVLEAFIQQKMLDGLPDDVQELINMAASVLDVYLPVPAPDQYLKAWQLGYLKAFLQGVAAGASEYASATATKDFKTNSDKGKWFKPVKKSK